LRFTYKRGNTMHTRQAFAASAATILIAFAAPAYAGHNGDSVGAGLVGFGIGAVVGSALTPSTVVVAPPPPPAYAPPPPAYAPPPPAYPAAYGPPPWSPGWYSYCRNSYGPQLQPKYRILPGCRWRLVFLQIAHRLLRKTGRRLFRTHIFTHGDLRAAVE